MERKNKTKISKNFFSINRPTVSSNKALEDEAPVQWIDKKEKKNQKKDKAAKKNV